MGTLHFLLKKGAIMAEKMKKETIHNWLRGRDIVEFLGLWESLHNHDFKVIAFDNFKEDADSINYVFDYGKSPCLLLC